MNRRIIPGSLILILSLIIFAGAVWTHGSRIRLSASRISEAEAEKIREARKETGGELLKTLVFNDSVLFPDESSGTFYYSLIEDDPDASDPFIRLKGKNRKVRIALTEGAITDESIRGDTPLHILAYDDRSYREYRIRCTTLPLMNISSEIEFVYGAGKDRDMQLTLLDNRAEARQRLVRLSGTIHVRGNSATLYPKLGFKFTLQEMSPGNHIREADRSLLGMREDGEWLLYAGYNDQERIRNVFSSALWNRSCAGANEFGILNGMEYRFLELFMNGQYWGLYALGYPLDDKQMRPTQNTGEAEAVYVFKKTFWNEDWSDLPEELPARDFETKGKDALRDEAAARAILRDYLRWLEDPAADPAPGAVPIRADMENAIDTWLFVNLIQGTDTVAANGDFINMFFTMVRTKDGTVVISTPWDMDLSWGNTRDPDAKNVTAEYALQPEDNSCVMLRNPAQFLLPDKGGMIAARYRFLRENGWSDAAVDSLLTRFEAEIFDSGAYLRDTEKWPDSNREDPAAGLSRFTGYVRQRLSAMDAFAEELDENGSF